MAIAKIIARPDLRRRAVAKSIIAALFAIATAAPAPVAAASKNREVAVRLVAQEGLAIALASTVLQTQLYVLITALQFEKGCQKLNGGGSFKPTTKSKPTPEDGAISVNFYFDKACRSLFAEAAMNERLVGDEKNGQYVLTGDVAYHDRAGKRVGVMAIEEKAVIEKGVLSSVSGLGTFTPSNGKPEVYLGLACDMPEDLSIPFVCHGGAAQAFPDLGLSLGLVAPLELHLKNRSVVFRGEKSTFATAAEGSLRVKRLGKTALALSEPFKAVGSAEAQGSAAAFGLFPPTPTRWSVTDKERGLTFKLDVVSNEKRNSVATIVDASGKRLALIKVDQSGTGWISYFGGPRVPVVSWTLGG